MVLYGHMAAQCMLLADVVDGKLQLSQVQYMDHLSIPDVSAGSVCVYGVSVYKHCA